jgi:hypothetical protein
MFRASQLYREANQNGLAAEPSQYILGKLNPVIRSLEADPNPRVPDSDQAIKDILRREFELAAGRLALQWIADGKVPAFVAPSLVELREKYTGMDVQVAKSLGISIQEIQANKVNIEAALTGKPVPSPVLGMEVE